MELFEIENATARVVLDAILGAGLFAFGATILLSAAEAVILVKQSERVTARGALSSYILAFARALPAIVAFSVPVGLLAYIAGYLTAFSRTGAVGNLVPAAIAVVAGLNIYVFGTDTKYKVLVGYCVCLFAVMILHGINAGATYRDVEREIRLQELAGQEARVRTYRENLKLPPDPPGWILSTEPH